MTEGADLVANVGYLWFKKASGNFSGELNFNLADDQSWRLAWHFLMFCPTCDSIDCWSISSGFHRPCFGVREIATKVCPRKGVIVSISK